MDCLMQAYYKQQIKIRLIRGDIAKEKSVSKRNELKLFLAKHYKITDNILKEIGFEYFFLNVNTRYMDKFN